MIIEERRSPMPVIPSDKEQEFFARQEWERKRKVAHEHEERLKAAERNKLKEQHWMRCPKCGMELVEIEYRGLKLDQCSSCSGVWLDAGELDTLATSEKSGFLGGLQAFFKG
jgi:hypothetical protein